MSDPKRPDLADQHPTLFAVGAAAVVLGIVGTAVLAYVQAELNRWTLAPLLVGMLLFVGTAWAAAVIDSHKRRPRE